MGLEFGHLTRIVGITYYTLSPHEQKALAGTINPGIKNVLRRTRESMFVFGIPVLIVYAITKASLEYHHKINRKNPADFVNDV